MLQALRAAGLPDEEIPAHCHRLAVLLVALIPSDAGIGTVTPEDREQGLGQLRVAVLGVGPERSPALAHLARDVRPLSSDRPAAFEDILAPPTSTTSRRRPSAPGADAGRTAVRCLSAKMPRRAPPEKWALPSFRER